MSTQQQAETINERETAPVPGINEDSDGATTTTTRPGIRKRSRPVGLWVDGREGGEPRIYVKFMHELPSAVVPRLINKHIEFTDLDEEEAEKWDVRMDKIIGAYYRHGENPINAAAWRGKTMKEFKEDPETRNMQMDVKFSITLGMQ